MVFRMGLRLIAIGIIIGVLVTFAATHVISSQLFGISSVDPVTFGGVIVVIGVTGLAACYYPARRATRVDPMVALRYE
jgi:putative ABC transport system permease protein